MFKPPTVQSASTTTLSLFGVNCCKILLIVQSTGNVSKLSGSRGKINTTIMCYQQNVVSYDDLNLVNSSYNTNIKIWVS